MTASIRWQWALGIAGLGLTLVFLPKILIGDSALYTRVLTPALTLAIGALGKLAFLVSAAIFAARCLPYFERGNPVRPAWWLLTLGMGCYALGQASLSFYQLVLLQPSPFPSLGDLFFISSMLFLIAALIVFLIAYDRVGYPVGTLPQTAALILVAAALLGGSMLWILRPILTQPAPWGEKALNVAYPALDCLLLIPALLLLRVSYRLRGGSVWRVWMALLGGFFFVAIGDLLFAYFTTLGMATLDALIDLLFIYGYLLIAWGMVDQYRILSS